MSRCVCVLLLFSSLCFLFMASIFGKTSMQTSGKLLLDTMLMVLGVSQAKSAVAIVGKERSFVAKKEKRETQKEHKDG